MKEDYIQKQCVQWFIQTYPELQGLLCYNLNNSRNKVAGANNKRMGLIKGRSDMVLYFKGVATMMEFKTSTGRQNQSQKDWQKLIEWQGFSYYIIRSLDEFKQVINHIIQT